MSACCVAAAAADIHQTESGAYDAHDAGPRPPVSVALMQSRHEQADHEGNAPECHPDLDYSSGVAG